MGGTVSLNDSLIMMVDDEPIMIDLIQFFLEDAGYQNFLGQSDSVCAVELVQTRKPDILLLDLVMPDVNGFEVLESLRSIESTQHLPIVVLTSSSDAETKLKALELGATDFLAKPVDPSELVLRVRNILTVKAYQDRLTYTDTLTELPNRKFCIERLSEAMLSAQEKQTELAVIGIKLTSFKTLNDSYGPSVGDAILKEAAARLLNGIRVSDLRDHQDTSESMKIIFKTSGDEFSVLLSDTQSDDDVSFVAEQLIKAFVAPFELEQHSLYISISLGIAVYPGDGDSAEVIIKNASYAANSSADDVPGGLQFYSQEANQHLQDRMQMQQDLKKAIENDDFYLVYQPQVDVVTGRVRGAETLLRWTHPSQRDISPGIFVPVAEQCGLMEEIGSWVFKHACRQAASWQKQGMDDFSVSVNVSSQQFQAPGFVEFVTACLEETQVIPETIVVELTESLAMTDLSKTDHVLRQLKALKVKISVDDFGTGYSSLSYLKSFPLDELKVDKAFVDGLPDNKGDQAITSAIITMAKKLNFLVVAEGIENQRQADYLGAAGCDLFQGFHFSRPLKVDDFNAYHKLHSQVAEVYLAEG